MRHTDFKRKTIKTLLETAAVAARPKPRAIPVAELGNTFHSLREAKRIKEATQDAGPVYRVQIISAGPGNAADKHFYTPAFIESAVEVFNGKPCYANHPSESEMVDRPERDVREIIGYFENLSAENGALLADLELLPGPDYAWADTLLRASIRYAQKFPGQELCGFSINAKGKTQPGNHDGEDDWKDVTRATEAVSADLVTLPGARGKVIGAKAQEAMREANREVKLAAILGALQKKTGDNKELKRMVESAIEAMKAEDREDTMAKEKGVVDPKGAHPELVSAEAHTLAAAHHTQMAQDTEGDEAKNHKALADLHTKMAAGFKKAAESKKESKEAQPAAAADPEDNPADGGDGGADEKDEEGKESKQVESLRKELKALREANAKTMISSKLKESKLPEVTHKALAIQMRGMTEEQMDELLEAKAEEYKALYSDGFGTHAMESHRAGGSQGAAVSILKEAGFELETAKEE